VQVGNRNPRSQNSVIRVFRRQVRSGLGGQVVQFDSGHTLMNTCCDLLGNPAKVDFRDEKTAQDRVFEHLDSLDRLDKVAVQTIRELVDSSGDLVKPEWPFDRFRHGCKGES
jgi:hypothetical protein